MAVVGVELETLVSELDALSCLLYKNKSAFSKVVIRTFVNIPFGLLFVWLGLEQV